MSDVRQNAETTAIAEATPRYVAVGFPLGPIGDATGRNQLGEAVGEETQDQIQAHESCSVEEQSEVANTETPEESEGQEVGSNPEKAMEHSDNDESQSTTESSEPSQSEGATGSDKSEEEGYGY